MMIEELADTLRFAIGRNKLKYESLNEMIDLPKVDCVHINLTGIFNHLIVKYFTKSDVIDDEYKYLIASSILNIAAHYRHYFVKKKMYPTIYLYCGDTGFEAIDKALGLVKIISSYIPKIYFIDCSGYKDNTNVFIKYFIKQDKNSYHLILSKEIRDIQLINDKRHMIILNKDNSKYYSPVNMYENILEKKLDFQLDRHLIGPLLFYSGIGCKNKGVKGAGKITTAKLFNDAIKTGDLTPTKYSSAEDFVTDIRRYIGSEIDLINFINNFNRYDVYKKYDDIITKSMETNLNDCIIDKFSRTDLAQLNNKYFTGVDSLMLDFLLEEPKKGFYE